MTAITRWTNLLRASMLTALLLAGFSSAPATANNYVINSVADTNDNFCDASSCTLREAIAAANSNAGADTITFDTTVFNSAKTITVGSQLPSFSESATITGPPAGVTVDGVTKAFTIFTVSGGTVNIIGLTVSNGYRGIYSDGGTAVVVGCTLSGNDRGVEYDRRTATITNCTLSGNTVGIYSYRENTLTIAGCTSSGNAIGVKNSNEFNYPSYITLKNSLVVGNNANLEGPNFTSGADSFTLGTASGAGLDPAGLQNNGGPTKTIALMPGSLVINAGNDANAAGFTTDQRGTGYPRIYNGRVDIGAFEFGSGPKTFIVNSVADTNDNTCDVSNCTLREAIGAANSNLGNDTINFDTTVFNSAQTITVGSALPSFSEGATITGSAAGVTVDGVTKTFKIFTVNAGVSASFTSLTISNGNPGIFNSGTATVTGCTLTGNNIGIRNFDRANLINCTLSGNQYGIENQAIATATNSTISGNYVGFYDDGVATLKNSLIVGNTSEDVGGAGFYTDGGGNLIYGTGTASGAGLDPAGLQNNGGPTKTIALMPGSIAINAGLDANAAGLPTDQRGTGYARIVGSSVDIGAYELSLPLLSINDTSLTEGNSGTANATFTVTLSKASTQTVTVSYASANGTSNPATAGSDYTAKSGTLTFAPGAALTQTISVPIVGNYVPEADETFFVNLSSPVNATLSDSQGLGTITNDDFDTTPPTVSFTTSTTTPAGTTPQTGATVYNVVPAITGVAGDAGSGIARVQLRLYRLTSTAGVYEYWNGTGWVVPGGGVAIPMLITVLSPGAGSANVTWTRSTAWPTGSNLADGTYYLTAYAYDRAGKFASSSRNFKKATDTTGPSVSFTTAATTPVGTTPVSGSTVSGTMPTITGIAADSASGVGKVELRLYRATATAGVYENWTGSAWTTTLAALSTVMNPAAGGANVSWSRSSGWPGGGDFADGTYYLRATAYDKAGNLTATLASNFKKVTSAGQTLQLFEDEPSQ